MLALLAWMSYAFMEYGNTRLDRLLQLEDPIFGRPLIQGGGELTEWVTWSVFIALGMFIGGLVLLRWWLNRPRFADLLIETESELKRVRWAPRKEVNRATGVVLYFVLWFAIVMFVYDLTFTMGTGMLQGQSWQQVGWGRVVTMVFRLDNETQDQSQ
jgi:preprotein translocase SecE subunit